MKADIVKLENNTGDRLKYRKSPKVAIFLFGEKNFRPMFTSAFHFVKR